MASFNRVVESNKAQTKAIVFPSQLAKLTLFLLTEAL